MRFSKKHFSNPHATSLLEVIIATFLLAIAAVSATVLIVGALQANRISKNKMIAINLAREGLELVRNVRDSNWIQYSAYTKCWNVIPGVVCDGASPDSSNADAEYFIHHDAVVGSEAYYRIGIDPTDFTINLEASPNHEPLDLEFGAAADNNEFLLYSSGIDTDGDGVEDNFVYCHDNTATATDFYREIRFVYEDTNSSGDPDQEDQIVKVTSTVQWHERSRTHQVQVQLITKLTNYHD